MTLPPMARRRELLLRGQPAAGGGPAGRASQQDTDRAEEEAHGGRQGRAGTPTDRPLEI